MSYADAGGPAGKEPLVKDHAPAPLPASFWRAYLKHLAKWMLIAIAVLLVSAAVVGVSHA
jgi:hypothetical protein